MSESNTIYFGRHEDVFRLGPFNDDEDLDKTLQLTPFKVYTKFAKRPFVSYDFRGGQKWIISSLGYNIFPKTGEDGMNLPVDQQPDQYKLFCMLSFWAKNRKQSIEFV